MDKLEDGKTKVVVVDSEEVAGGGKGGRLAPGSLPVDTIPLLVPSPGTQYTQQLHSTSQLSIPCSGGVV